MKNHEKINRDHYIFGFILDFKKGNNIGTFDPNYQTLAGIGGEVFGEDKKKAGGGGGGAAPRAPEKGGVAG